MHEEFPCLEISGLYLFYILPLSPPVAQHTQFIQYLVTVRDCISLWSIQPTFQDLPYFMQLSGYG